MPQNPVEHTQKVTIDGTEYLVSDLNEEARNQLTNLRVTDAEIQHLQHQLAIAQTARATYANALKQALPKAEH